MLILLRRFMLLASLIVWQGGFTFHSAVVIPAGSKVLGSHLRQGFITQSATHWLNLIGAAALVLWAIDLSLSLDRGSARRYCRWGLWLLLIVTLGLLIALHVPLDELLDFDAIQVRDGPRFYVLHQWYLGISTLQWAASLVLLGLTLAAWRAEDKSS